MYSQLTSIKKSAFFGHLNSRKYIDLKDNIEFQALSEYIYVLFL